MAEITLAAATGRTTGSRASGRLRGSGKVPATVYGLGNDPVAVAVDWRELRHALTTEAGLNALINLEVDGHQSELTIVKEMQRHPIKRSVLHVDFLRVSRDVAIERIQLGLGYEYDPAVVDALQRVLTLRRGEPVATRDHPWDPALAQGTALS